MSVGTVSISRLSGGDGDKIRIEVNGTEVKLLRGTISLADFALCVTGREVPLQFEDACGAINDRTSSN